MGYCDNCYDLIDCEAYTYGAEDRPDWCPRAPRKEPEYFCSCGHKKVGKGTEEQHGCPNRECDHYDADKANAVIMEILKQDAKDRAIRKITQK